MLSIINPAEYDVLTFFRAMGDVSDRIGRPTDNGQVMNDVSLHCEFQSAEILYFPSLNNMCCH